MCEFTLTSEDKLFAEKNLNETDERRDKALREIKNWIKENQNLRIKCEDSAILPFLRGCKFNLEKTKVKLKNYYKLRKDIPEWFANRDPSLPIIQELVKLGVFLPLKKLSENRLVVIIRTAAHDPSKHTQNNVFKVGMMLLDVVAKECEKAQIYGVVAVFDMKNMSLEHAIQMKPVLIRNAVHAWQNYHVRPKQLEFINAPIYINVVLNVFKSFMSEKLRNRVKVHFGGLGNLHDNIDVELLPKDYGGSGESLDELSCYWAEKLLSYKNWFKEDENYKAV